MILKILWPGKTRDKNLRELQEHYLRKISRMERCELVETKEARGLKEESSRRIKKIEAEALERHIKDDYIICLVHDGEEMSSEEFARFLEKLASSVGRVVTFVVGGFLGLEEKILQRADSRISLSKLTFSHELARIMLLEQIYRSLTIIKGMKYAK